jgi:hypothetical protein
MTRFLVIDEAFFPPRKIAEVHAATIPQAMARLPRQTQQLVNVSPQVKFVPAPIAAARYRR